MNHHSYIILTLLILVHSRHLSQFEDLTFHYNTGNFKAIYDQFSTKATQDTTYDQFNSTLTTIYQNHGEIVHSTNATIDLVQNFFLISFKKSLGAGIMNWAYDSNKKITHFHINPCTNKSLIQFYEENPSKFQISMFLDEELIAYTNPIIQVPIYSFNTIAILIEYSRQVSINLINPNMQVQLESLNLYYVKYFDYNHAKFLNSLVDKQQIILQQLAEGLIQFNSKCIAEYFQALLGRDYIDATLQNLGSQQTSQTWHVSSYLAFTNIYNQSKEEYLERIENQSYLQFIQISNFIHNQLQSKTDLSQVILETAHIDLLDGRVSSIMTKYFTQSNSYDYTLLLKGMQNRQFRYISTQAYQKFQELMEKFVLNKRLIYDVVQRGQHYEVFGNSENVNCYFSALYFDSSKQLQQKQFGILVSKLDYELEFKNYQSAFNIFVQLLSSNNSYYVEIAKRINRSKISK